MAIMHKFNHVIIHDRNITTQHNKIWSYVIIDTPYKRSANEYMRNHLADNGHLVGKTTYTQNGIKIAYKINKMNLDQLLTRRLKVARQFDNAMKTWHYARIENTLPIDEINDLHIPVETLRNRHETIVKTLKANYSYTF